jgi:hypothetical protein
VRWKILVEALRSAAEWWDAIIIITDYWTPRDFSTENYKRNLLGHSVFGSNRTTYLPNTRQEDRTCPSISWRFLPWKMSVRILPVIQVIVGLSLHCFSRHNFAAQQNTEHRSCIQTRTASPTIRPGYGLLCQHCSISLRCWARLCFLCPWL